MLTVAAESCLPRIHAASASNAMPSRSVGSVLPRHATRSSASDWRRAVVRDRELVSLQVQQLLARHRRGRAGLRDGRGRKQDSSERQARCGSAVHLFSPRAAAILAGRGMTESRKFETHSLLCAGSAVYDCSMRYFLAACLLRAARFAGHGGGRCRDRVRGPRLDPAAGSAERRGGRRAAHSTIASFPRAPRARCRVRPTTGCG